MPDMEDLTDTYFDEEEDGEDTSLDADESRAEARLARKALGL